MTAAERAVRAAAAARDLCLSLRRAFAGPRALAALRRHEASGLTPEELQLALGLAWAARDIALVRDTIETLESERPRREGFGGAPVLPPSRAGPADHAPR